MAEPWFRMHANIGKRPITRRLMQTLGLKRAAAVGYLAMFWGAASQHCPSGGIIIEVPDEELEEWAGWDGRPGKFAAFIREQHTDETGRIKDWDEYCGKLEVKRAKERLRMATLRERTREEHATIEQQLAVRTRPSTQDCTQYSTPYGTQYSTQSVATPRVRDETIRDETELLTASASDDAGGEAGTEPTPTHTGSASVPHPRTKGGLVPTEDESEVLAHFRAQHPRRGPADDKQVRCVRKALKSFSVAQLQRAIDGNKHDDWHAARRKHELTYVLRDNDTISSFLERAEALDTPLVDEQNNLTEAGVRYFAGRGADAA